jgi:drug/metabolite transporter (DMT)-like permease
MKMKMLACFAFLLNTFLYGSYYSVAKEALGRIDPIVFTFLTMMTLLLPAIAIIIFSWRRMTRAAVKSGFILGSCLCLGLFTLAISLKYNTATGTAFFPALNGLLAVLFAWLFLRQPITKASWFAGAVSVSGAFLLIFNSSLGGGRGALIAFIGNLFCTAYVFLADREQRDPAAYWPLLGIELLTMALWANLIALLFGDWQVVAPSWPKDGIVVSYIGLGTIFLPILITVLLQKYISPVTVAFISVVEPILGALAAFLYLREVLPLDSYLGGALVVAGSLINTWGAVERPASRPALRRSLADLGQHLRNSPFGSLLYPLLCCGIGTFIVYRLGGFPPPSWLELYHRAPQILPLIQQGRGEIFLLIAQSTSWLVAWLALLVMASLAIYRACERIFHEEPQVQIDTRSLRQMGYTPYTMNASSQLRGEEKPLVQYRRQKRRARLISHNTNLNDREPLPTLAELGDARLLPLEPERYARNQFHDPVGNHWACWDDIEVSKVRER